MTGNNGQPQINPNTGQPYSYLEAYQAGKQAAQDTKPDKSNPTEVIKRKVGGVDHNILIDKVTGKGIQDWPQLACKENSPRRWFLMPRNAKGPDPYTDRISGILNANRQNRWRRRRYH